jgi:hypothetical protein
VVTFILYALIQFIPVFGVLFLLKRIQYFARESEWNIGKEILSIIILLLSVGVTVYFAGFIVELPADRWNLATFLNSIITASLLVVIPIIFFTVSNYRYLFFPDILQYYHQSPDQSVTNSGNVLRISSQLKKEELSFYPSQFIFAESDGNYVVFHLVQDGRYVRKTIRNSINEIEQQLSYVPGIMRIHRAFIVNLGKVTSKKGNSLGYKLKLSETEIEIPVSRNNTRNFDQRMKQFA